MVAIPRKVGISNDNQVFYPAISGPPSLAEVQDAVNKANAKLSRGIDKTALAA